MRFQDFMKAGKVRKGRPDVQLAKSLLKMSDNHIETLKSITLTDKTASTLMANFYEALREVVEAIAVKDGYKVYSHEAFTYFLKEMGESRISEKFDRFRKIRNRINYYGNLIDAESANANIEEIRSIISELKEKRLKNMLKS